MTPLRQKPSKDAKSGKRLNKSSSFGDASDFDKTGDEKNGNNEIWDELEEEVQSHLNHNNGHIGGKTTEVDSTQAQDEYKKNLDISNKIRQGDIQVSLPKMGAGNENP
jgi:hypothetical protein